MKTNKDVRGKSMDIIQTLKKERCKLTKLKQEIALEHFSDIFNDNTFEEYMKKKQDINARLTAVNTSINAIKRYDVKK